MSSVRPAAIAGMFYPGNAGELARTVDTLLAQAAPTAVTAAGAAAGPVPKAIIAPHAGFIYSGPVAARIYARLAPARQRIRRIVLLGPTHRVAIHGMALPGVHAFATPLGEVPIDTFAVAELLKLPFVGNNIEAHRLEHCLEVHVPFFQRMFEQFTLVPLAVGNATAAQVAQVLELLWGGPETLVVVSSDLSHYHSYAAAQVIDRATVQSILQLHTDIGHRQACGATPVAGLNLYAQRHGLAPELIDLRNSGDTAGDKSRVVGYASFAYHEMNQPPSNVTPATPAAAPTTSSTPISTPATTQISGSEVAGTLLGLARGAIADKLGRPHAPAARDAVWLKAQGATFVTLHLDKKLRGCIGSLRSHRALLDDVTSNALAAAFHDPRFKPLTVEEYDKVEVEVSLLSGLTPLQFSDEAAALAQLQPNVHGVIFEYGHHRSTYLPQVWAQIPAREMFMATLKQKAGLPPNFWDPAVKLYTYTVAKFTEPAGAA